MKYLVVVCLIFLIFLSCTQSKLEKEKDDLQLKSLRLRYLKDLYDVRDDIDYNERKRKIDSLINVEELNVNL